MKQAGTNQEQSASDLISNNIAEPGDRRGDTLARMRKLKLARRSPSTVSIIGRGIRTLWDTGRRFGAPTRG